ncbi:DUF1576 domain-containing protein [Erysipelothrix urinaevulpis]|uniref:DUF1576 domain-containing protein n=1 Tax=Erysipelothrix urinaevulpis TaxID=2683717 RepID=UPI0013585A87|nr:DUF1576 domain-containing protein [Erysipelothrix urinaevulpis]
MEKNSRPLVLLALFFIILGIFQGASLESFRHLVVTADVLVADYFQIAGEGSTYLNVGVMLLSSTFLLCFLDVKFNGIVVSSLFLIIGFSFFGKNILNATPIVIGGLIANYVHHDDIQRTIPYILAATGLSPLVSEIMFHLPYSFFITVPLAIVVGISVGFITPSITIYLRKAHKGLTLYGTGFSLGFISLVYVSIMILFSYQFQSVDFWSHETVLKIHLALIFIVILLGVWLKGGSWGEYKELLQDHNIEKMDYLNHYSVETSVMNMALNGLVVLAYLQLIQAPLNAPTLGALLVVVGFGVYGKTPYSIIPILISIYLGGILNIWDPTSPAMIFAALFGTSLAPIVHHFGIGPGMLASFLNATISTQTGAFHGGLDLYNTGFAAGIIAVLFAAVAESFSHRKL